MNVREWQAFVAVYDQGSFTRAARSLGTAQSNISARIRNLETTIGIRLFVRRYRVVIPTEKAELLYTRIKPAIATLDTMSRELVPPQSRLT